MDIQYISDIHLEFMDTNEYQYFLKNFSPKAKILVLAGDIGYPHLPSYKQFLEHISPLFTKIFLIAGNHEFYGSSVEKNIPLIQDIVSKIPNITFLNNTMEDYEGITWIGTTLWSAITNPYYTINDTNQIEGMNVRTYNELHAEAVDFLKTALANCKRENKKVVVITHHLPISELVMPQFRTEQYKPYNQWFHANLDSLIQMHNTNILAWFYGHTHAESIQTHYKVPFYCFSKGYPNEKCKKNNYNTICKI